MKHPRCSNRPARLVGYMFAASVLTATLFGLGSTASAETLYIDFGQSTLQMASPTGGTYWNNIDNTTASTGGGGSVGYALALITESNAASSITLTMTDLFANENHGGTSTPTTSVSEFNYTNLGLDSLYVSGGDNTAAFTLSGLDTSTQYVFTMFASRTGVSGERAADYTLTGANTDTVTLDATGNTSNIVSTVAITPNASGEITFTMAMNGTSTFAYLGGMQITAIPEPATAAGALGIAVLVLCYRHSCLQHQ